MILLKTIVSDSISAHKSPRPFWQPQRKTSLFPQGVGPACSVVPHRPASALLTSLTQCALVINFSIVYSRKAAWCCLRAFVISGSSLLNAFPRYLNGSFSLCLGLCVILSECAVLMPVYLVAFLPPAPSPHTSHYILYIYFPPSMRI